MSARTGRQRRYGGNGPEVTSRAGSWEVREGVRCTRHRPSPCLQAAESLGGWGGRFGGGAGVFRRLARDEGRRIVWLLLVRHAAQRPNSANTMRWGGGGGW